MSGEVAAGLAAAFPDSAKLLGPEQAATGTAIESAFAPALQPTNNRVSELESRVGALEALVSKFTGQASAPTSPSKPSVPTPTPVPGSTPPSATPIPTPLPTPTPDNPSGGGSSGTGEGGSSGSGGQGGSQPGDTTDNNGFTGGAAPTPTPNGFTEE